MELFVSFVLSVAAGVVSNCISKWLDGERKALKTVSRVSLELLLNMTRTEIQSSQDSEEYQSLV